MNNLEDECHKTYKECKESTIIIVIWMFLVLVSTLQNACRDKILQLTSEEDLNKLPLPKKLKQFLRYEL